MDQSQGHGKPKVGPNQSSHHPSTVPTACDRRTARKREPTLHSRKTLYGDTMMTLKQFTTHSNIIDIGESVHQYYITKFQKEKDDCKKAAIDGAWVKADLEIEKMVLKTLQLAKMEREILKKKVENANAYLQETLVEYDMKTKRRIMSDIEKLRKRNEERASQEIHRAIEKIAQQHAKNVVIAGRKEKETTMCAATMLERDFMLQPEHAKVVASKNKNEILAEISVVMRSSIAGNIERARKEEREIAQQNVNQVERKYRAELTTLKESAQQLEALLYKTSRDLRAALADKQVYVDDLEDTRAAFQAFINLQFKELKPDQADFILPSKKIDRM